MKTDKRVIKYIDGSLPEGEKEAFEKLLAESPELKVELKRVQNIIGELKKAGSPEVDETYFNQIVPRFRERLEKDKNKSFIPGLAVGAATVVAAIIVFLVMYNPIYNIPVSNSADTTFAAQLSDQDVYNVLQSYSLNNDFYSVPVNGNNNTGIDSVLSQMITSQLNLDSVHVLDLYAANENGDIQSLVNSMDKSEAENIYKELLKKKIY